MPLAFSDEEEDRGRVLLPRDDGTEFGTGKDAVSGRDVPREVMDERRGTGEEDRLPPGVGDDCRETKGAVRGD